MTENKYRIVYKNGKSIETKAYSMKIHEGKVYQCCRAGFGYDNGVPSVFSAEHIDHIECIEKNNNLDEEVE